jgi:signal transduction histidine kinase
MSAAMKLGVRLTLLATLLMGLALALSTWLLGNLRRGELESDLASAAWDKAGLLVRALEPLAKADAERVLEEQRLQFDAEVAPFVIDLVVFPPNRPTDPGWAQLYEAATIDRKATGRLFAPSGHKAFFAMAVPVFDALPSEPSRKQVAVLGLRRDAAHIDQAVAHTLRRALPAVAAVVGMFGLAVYILLRSGVLAPLRRLNDAIDAVAAGDLSRALLPQRDDEIGLLAARFNHMTESLREARSDQARATDARQNMQERLRHSEKLATMGQMAAQIAHEVGTPLNVIGGRARALSKKAADAAEVHKNAEIISTQVERITRIIKQVLSFSRKSSPTTTQVDVENVLRESLEFLSETLTRQQVRSVLEIHAQLPSVPGDRGEIQQVCLNLIQNALHAMPTGGTLTLRLAQVVQRKGGLDLAPPAPFLLLEVRDTGAGIDPAHRERIFEPFFTTKDSGEGTGLGLAVTKGIVTDLDGWMTVDSPDNGGAVFRAYLPLQTDPSLDLGKTLS